MKEIKTKLGLKKNKNTRNYQEEEMWALGQYNFKKIKSPRVPQVSVLTFLKWEKGGTEGT